MRTILLLTIWCGVLCPQTGVACETDFVNRTTASFGGLEITFATDSTAYVVGDSVYFHFCIRNDSATAFVWHSSDRPEVAFWVLGDTCETPAPWECFDQGPHVYPETVVFIERDTVIPPGESQTWTHGWGGRRWMGEFPSTGTYQVYGGLRGGDPNAETIGVPPGGAQLTLTLTSTSDVPVTQSTWGTIKARVRN